jgi:hypothetical protein
VRSASRTRLIPWLAGLVAIGILPSLPAVSAPAGGTPLRAGAAVIDATWHVGASQGQYSDYGPGVHDLDEGTVDPHAHALASNPTHGVESRDTVRALVMDDGDGGRWALVTNDLYIPQDLVNQRVATLLAEHDLLNPESATGITADTLTVSVSHSHSSPFYSSTTWGAWAFQDVFDLRFFEFIARRMADAVITASGDLRPARAAAAQVPIAVTKRNPEGPAVSEEPEPLPAGWAHDQTDGQITLVRVDDVSGSTPAPLANWVAFGRHPEGMKDNGLHTGEYTGALQRILDRELGGVTLFSQNDTGSSEIAKESKAHVGAARAEYDKNSHHMLERVARDLADAVLQGSEDITTTYAAGGGGGGGKPGKDKGKGKGKGHDKPDDEPAPATLSDVALIGTDAPVAVSTQRFAPPSYRPFATISNCRTERAAGGDPGVPVVGLPDCTYVMPEELKEASPVDPGVTYSTLREAGVPVPDSYGFPSYISLQESSHVVLQAIKLGRVAVVVCPCEMFTDQARNMRSRLDTVAGNQWFGFDWTASAKHSADFEPGVAYVGDLLPDEVLGEGVRRGPVQLDIDPSTPGEQWWCEPNSRTAPTTWTCKDPRPYGWGMDAPLPSWDAWPTLAPVSHASFVRWKARMYNDARGWDGYLGEDGSPDALTAESEPTDPTKIWGNWTHEELTEDGYDLVVTVSMSNDYWGYIPTYREWQARDFYRKALAGLGPHSSDFFATRLTRMAASLNGGAPVELTPKDLAYAPEENGQAAKATAIGNLAEAYLPLYEAALPADGGTPGTAVTQPADTQRFGFTTFSWVGGSNYADVPHARVERRDETSGEWRPFGNGYGEVQVRLAMPKPEQLPLVAAGQFPWTWTASFEAYDSDITRTYLDGVRRPQVPDGTYRFVVDGCARGLVPDGSADAACSEWDASGRVQPYAVASESFEVTPWEGITVSAPQPTAGGLSVDVGPDLAHPLTASNTALATFSSRTGLLGTQSLDYSLGLFDYAARDAVDYPDAVGATHPERKYLTGRSGDDVIRRHASAQPELFCFRCSFEPWADTGAVASVTVTVERATGGVERLPATFDVATRRWVAAVTLATGDRAYVAAGDVRDTWGERNGAPSPVLTGP